MRKGVKTKPRRMAILSYSSSQDNGPRNKGRSYIFNFSAPSSTAPVSATPTIAEKPNPLMSISSITMVPRFPRTCPSFHTCSERKKLEKKKKKTKHGDEMASVKGRKHQGGGLAKHAQSQKHPSTCRTRDINVRLFSASMNEGERMAVAHF